ncbi:MAG: hypothetical protein GEV05_21060 [Betaproteobacteria bacterium]|nr:hypothetical protein [Betaproteobacteria bacterium]
MSDYFGALLRSSGMTLPQDGGSARPVAERTAPAEVSPAEQPASLPAPTSHAIGEPVPHPALAPTTLAVQRVTAQIESGPESPLRREAISDDAARSAQTLAAETNPAAPRATPSAGEESHAPQPPLAHALVDAALRWVAAGEQPDRRRTPAHGNEPAPSFAERSGHAAAHAKDPASQFETPMARAHPVAPPTVAHERSAVPMSPLRSETPSIAPARIAEIVDRDPPLDISIGAIHVRVDAPAAQTVTQALAPRQVVAPRAAPGRSALARRALRRI